MRLRGGGRENQRFAGSNIGITLGNYTPSEGPREEMVGEKKMEIRKVPVFAENSILTPQFYIENK
jgi:hypothetical protein